MTYSEPGSAQFPANRFRPGDTWRSPRGKDWYVQRIDAKGRAVLRGVDNPGSRQYRGDLAVGSTITDAWFRVDPPHS